MLSFKKELEKSERRCEQISHQYEVRSSMDEKLPPDSLHDLCQIHRMVLFSEILMGQKK